MTLRRLTLLVSALVLVGVDPAIAAERKLYPASMCQRWSGSDLTYFFSAISPDKAKRTYVDCPIIRGTFLTRVDDWTYTTLGVLQGATVSATDLHPDEAVTCAIAEVNVDGHGAWGIVWPQESTAGASLEAQTLSFDTSNVYHAYHRHAYLSCSIPPASNGEHSRIGSYAVSEKPSP